MSITPNVYAKARSEIIALFGWSADSLSPDQSLRLDCAVALRLALDDLQGRIVRGESIDVNRMLVAAEALGRILPPAALASPPPPADAPDPRETMWQTYLGMRRRGELAASYLSPQQRLEAARAKVAEIEAELVALVPPPEEPGASTGGQIPPVGGNVVPLGLPGSRVIPQPPAQPPAPPPPAAAAPAAPRNWDETPGGVAWNNWRDAGGSYAVPGSIGDRWSDHRDYRVRQHN